MSNDNVPPEDQAAFNEVARSVMRKLAAGRSAEDVARELHAGGWQKSTADALVEHVQEGWRQVEAAPLANAGIYLPMKFPEMRPVGSVPTLHTVNGIGTGFYGSRDADRPTGSYVKTQCFCIFFIPIFAIKSYRVTSRGSGWNLIGRVPLSQFAKMWNIVFLCGLLAMIGFAVVHAYIDSPDYQAGRKLGRADQAAAAGRLLEAARLYREVAGTRTEQVPTARERCAKLIERPEIETMPLGDVTQLFEQVVQSRVVGDGAPAVVARGVAIVKSHAQADPAASIALLACLARLSSSEACKTFGELLDGPLGRLPPAETIAVFRAAAAMPRENDQKTAFVELGVKQGRRLADADLPAAVDLLAILAPLGDRPAIDKCLDDFLGAPLDKAPCADVIKVVRAAKAFADAEGEQRLFPAGFAWVEHHQQAAPSEVFGLLDQLAELPGADRARIAAIRRPLLEKLVAANPQDVDLAVQLALVWEQDAEEESGKHSGSDDNGARIVKLLAPLRDKLGTGEGARLLGQVLAAEGKFDDAYALLSPYLGKHLAAFHEAEQAFDDAVEQVRTRIVGQLQQGTAPGFDYQRANLVSEEQANTMAREYLSRQVKDDPGVDAARETLAKQGMVVPAALDLGMVTLQRAQAMTDPAARRAELERAEKTFQAIRGTGAEETDQYLLRMGQVHYWLGKQKDGQDEFDKLLAKHGRKAEMLYSLANVLRDLGASPEARKFMQEGYEKATDEKLRHSIAYLRAITATGMDDELKWLERCNASDPGVKALLASSRGSRAEIQGKDDEAAAAYREAVAIYEAQPQDASVLNNGALASLSLFEISGDRQALERGTQWLEKAVSLNPMDSLVLGNASRQMLRAAVQDLAGSELNLRELQVSEPVSELYFLAGDQKGLDELRRRAREHAGLRKALNYMERFNVLAPKNLEGNFSALAVYGFLRDRAALQRLARQVAADKPDVEEVNTRQLKNYQYKEEDFGKERLKSRIARTVALVKRLSAHDKGPAYAAAVDTLVDLKISLPEDEAVDADELVRLAEDAHRAAPSLATYGLLTEALMYRAGKKLAADSPEYANATRGTARAAAASYTVALAMGRGDALGKAARENKDVQQAIGLAVARSEAFPEMRGVWEWAVLGAAEPGRADLRAKCLAPDELEEVQNQISQILMPINSRAAFQNYWRRLAAGDAGARAPLDQLVKLGVPLPVGLIQVEAEKK
jgi:hypothetical protein